MRVPPEAPSSWAQRLIAAGGPNLPLYGSPEWAALADRDPRKVASCVRAAEAWRRDSDPSEIAHRMREELAVMRAIDEDAYWTPQVVAGVHAVARRLLQRPDPIDGRPRPGDYRGGPVPWEPATRAGAA